MPSTYYVYSLRSRGKVVYIGMTTNPKRRAAQHQRDGKVGKMKIERSFSSKLSARLSEAIRLRNFRSRHGRNPRYNETDGGGWRS